MGRSSCHFPAGGQHKNGDVAIPVYRATHLKTILSGQHDIEYHQVDVTVREAMQTLLRMQGADEFQLIATEIFSQGLRQMLVIVNQ